MIDQVANHADGFGPVRFFCGPDRLGKFRHGALVVFERVGVDFNHGAVIGFGNLAFDVCEFCFQFRQLVDQCR
ncbi:hypothetical protein [Thalassospira xiamenensis]|uniref:hypothetical protein n=1 Tax=Thalassospira xiamenensis TaxID=220697 RepID=UPI00215DB4ED|nr:hypothetical protein [Thalassospira xiamenensis]